MWLTEHLAYADEQYFSVPLQVMRRKLLGLRDSLAASSVWRPKFKQALERYPELTLVRLDFAVPSCDACHLGGRMSTLLGRLAGSPYATSGFEPVSAIISCYPTVFSTLCVPRVLLKSTIY